jgi:dihydroceramidase
MELRFKQHFVYRFIADPNSKIGYKLPLALAAYSGIVTYSYILINNPVFHQISYAILVFTVVFRAVYLTKKIPSIYTYERPQLTRLLWMSAFGFILAFVLWNIDNQFCSSLREWRHGVSLITGSVSEVYIFIFTIFLNIIRVILIRPFIASWLVAHWHR